MFSDKRFVTKVSVDKRGRPKSFATKENFEKFYELESSSSDDEAEEEKSKKEKNDDSDNSDSDEDDYKNHDKKLSNKERKVSNPNHALVLLTITTKQT